MRDPYEILGIRPGASEEEVQEAYRQRASVLPMEDRTNVEVEALNTAYDQIIAQLRGQVDYTDSSTNSSEFSDIRRLLQNGRTAEAEELLDGIPEMLRTAEWYFLKGTVFYEKGFLDIAYEYLESATQIDPYNEEYASAFRRVSSQEQGFMQGNPYADKAGMSGCDCCTALLCLNCCTSCARGGSCVG